MRLQADAAAGKLGMADLKGGTFSISNIGNLGATYTGPVINLRGGYRWPRQDAPGAQVRRERQPRQGEHHERSWSADHRVIDGATMARFSNSWISYLENPQLAPSSVRQSAALRMLCRVLPCARSSEVEVTQDGSGWACGVRVRSSAGRNSKH